MKPLHIFLDGSNIALGLKALLPTLLSQQVDQKFSLFYFVSVKGPCSFVASRVNFCRYWHLTQHENWCRHQGIAAQVYFVQAQIEKQSIFEKAVNSKVVLSSNWSLRQPWARAWMNQTATTLSFNIHNECTCALQYYINNQQLSLWTIQRCQQFSRFSYSWPPRVLQV